MISTRVAVKYLLLSFISLATNAVAEVPSWALIAKSHLIVKASCTLPMEEFLRDQKKQSFDFLSIKCQMFKVYKGSSSIGVFDIKYQAKGRTDAPSPSRILDLNNKTALLFLENNDWPGHEGRYFTSFEPSSAAIEFSDSAEDYVVSEIAWQNEAVKNLEKKALDLPLYEQVKILIAGLSMPNRAEVSHDSLLNLGPKAVPSIVMLMENFNRVEFASLNSSPLAGVTVVSSPSLVVDDLAIILGQLTQISFGELTNGGSERERRAVIFGWRVWLAKQLQDRRLF